MAADLILTNGVVHTVDAARSVREAVAVADGRIVAVGSAGEMAELAGPGTRIVDVEGGMVLPGFQDAHCHLALSGYEQTLCDLFESRGAERAPAPHRRVRTGIPRPRLGAGRGLVDERFCGRHPHPRAAGRGRGRPAGGAHQPRRARILG